MQAIRDFINAPASAPKQLGIVLIMLLSLIFAPQVVPNDWQLNTRHLSDGLDIYANPSFVYPPWSLGILFVYRLMTAIGARLLGGLAILWLAHRRGWSLGHFVAIVANPFFVFAMLFSNVDLLVFLLPIVLWEAARGKNGWGVIGQAFAILLLLVKPQGSFLIILFLIYRERANWQRLIYVLGVVTIFVVPISLLGNPPLLLQWIDNIANPSTENLQYWADNNISLTSHSGLLPAILVTSAVIGIVFAIFRKMNKSWTINHTYTALLLSAMLISPYTSNQSIIPALAFSPSASATTLHYVITFTVGQTDLFARFVPYWIILFGVISLWFSRADQSTQERKLALSDQKDSSTYGQHQTSHSQLS